MKDPAVTDPGASDPTQIFVSVGSQMPFDRLISTVDRWAAERGCADRVFAQIGDGPPPSNIAWARALVAPEFEQRVIDAGLIVSHAGMGTILTALRHAKPIIVFPRRAELREHRSDHQMSTIDRFRGRPGIHAAVDEAELVELLDRGTELGNGDAISDHASDELLRTIRDFIDA